MENAADINEEGGLESLLLYVKELEISLAKKDQQLAANDARIGDLEATVSVAKTKQPGASASSVFRPKTATPRDQAGAEHSESASSSPNQVSDDSADAEETLSTSLSLNTSLSGIAHVPSSEDNAEHEGSPIDGRWNIPFDGSFDEELTAKSPPRKAPGQENALKVVGGFVPINKEGRRQSSGGGSASPIRPVPRSIAASPFGLTIRRSLLPDVSKGKENISPTRTDSPSLALREIR